MLLPQESYTLTRGELTQLLLLAVREGWLSSAEGHNSEYRSEAMKRADPDCSKLFQRDFEITVQQAKERGILHG